METWFIITVSLCIAAILRSLLHRRSGKNLPPGPSLLHSSFLLLTNSPANFKPVLINLKTKYGPFFTLSTGLGPSIFVSSHSLAHYTLVKKGAVFSDRPKVFINFNISSTPYGPSWRLLRRNMASGIMHANRIKSYAEARKWAVHVLISRLLEQEDGVKVVDHVHEAIFRMLVLMCFGEKLDEFGVKEIEKVERDTRLLVGSGRFGIVRMFPKVGKILFSNVWKKFEKVRDRKEQVLVPIIESRIESCRLEQEKVAYVDTLANLELPRNSNGENGENGENGRKLTQREMVSLCSEFLTGGTDTTVSAIQWIMANLVKHPRIQSKLYDEIVAVVGPPPSPELESVINEEDLVKMPYLKAVVLEGLRRHPPAHLVLPHRVMNEVEVQGYVIPQGAIINFMVSEMGLDEEVWDDPMEFKPERFLGNDGVDCVFDVSGRKRIKMMPFGAGRRICPGSDLALLHLEYFVANLVWYFDWSVADGYEVDLSEKVEFTVVMKNPLRARVTSRARNQAN